MRHYGGLNEANKFATLVYLARSDGGGGNSWHSRRFGGAENYQPPRRGAGTCGKAGYRKPDAGTQALPSGQSALPRYRTGIACIGHTADYRAASAKLEIRRIC